MTAIIQRSFAALFAAALLAGCGSDSATGPSSPRTLDLSAAIAQTSAGGLGAIAGAASMSAMPATVTAPAVDPSLCTYSPTTGGSTCPAIVTNGLTFKVTYYLADAAGHPQTAPDVATTASVRTVTDVSGTVLLPPTSDYTGSVNIIDHSDLTLSGLLTGTRTLNGTTTSHDDVAITGSMPLHSIVDMTSVIANVVLADASSSNSWPKSGTVTSDTRTTTVVPVIGGVDVTTHSVITFNGTSAPTMTISVGGLPITCKIDLSGNTAPVCS